jgi:3-oxoacid CoA-transferase subunit B
MKERLSDEVMAMRAAKEFQDGNYVNLGYGIPNLCAMFISPEKEVYLHAEQGVLGYGRLLQEDEGERVDLDFVEAGVRPFETRKGLCFFDMDLSFDMIRGGHLDATVLGALEVSEKGDLANWSRGTQTAAGIGGGMDLAVGAKRVIIIMSHTTKKGEPKIVKRCKFPLTAKGCVDLIVTDIAVVACAGGKLVLKEHAPGWSAEEIQALTEPDLVLSEDFGEMEL